MFKTPEVIYTMYMKNDWSNIKWKGHLCVTIAIHMYFSFLFVLIIDALLQFPKCYFLVIQLSHHLLLLRFCNTYNFGNLACLKPLCFTLSKSLQIIFFLQMISTSHVLYPL
jgi:hypothetical protein